MAENLDPVAQAAAEVNAISTLFLCIGEWIGDVYRKIICGA